MSDDERRQRQMDFILEQQAHFTEQMQRADKRMDRLEQIAKLMIRAGRRERREWRERYNALLDSQIQTEALTRRNSEDIKRTEELVRRNSEDINRTEALTHRNSENIGRLEKIVEQMATGKNNGANGTDGA
jgi:hypothetical protein